jgi:hypothetical protein
VGGKAGSTVTMPPSKGKPSIPAQYDTVEDWHAAVVQVKQSSKLDRWSFFDVVKHDGLVKLSCVDCGAKLSAKNISSSLNAHIRLVDGSLCCSARTAERKKLSALLSTTSGALPVDEC